MSVHAMQRPIVNQLLDSKRIIAEKPQFTLHCGSSKTRETLESYIFDKYKRVHNASIDEFMPILLQMDNQHGTQAALGLRPGYYQNMVLEQYLESPIEQQVAGLSKQPVDRCKLIEIGNLAVTRPAAGLLMFVILAMSLAQAGFEWMVFTVTKEVERLMLRLGFEPYYLSSADSGSLNGDWGSYYEKNPQVMVGNLTHAVSIANSQPVLTAILENSHTEITAIASSLSDYRRLAIR